MEQKRKRITTTMKDNLAMLISFALMVFPANGEAPKLEEFTKSYKAFSSLANVAVEKGDLLEVGKVKGKGLAKDSTMEQIDEFLALSSISDLYHIKCENLLGGPKVFMISSPKRMGLRMIIGFTDEANINTTGAYRRPSPGHGRYVFYWDEKALRASLYKSDKFNDLAKSHQLNLAAVIPFSFPRLRDLVAAGPPPSSSGNSSHLPKEYIEAILADAKSKGYGEDSFSHHSPHSPSKEQNPASKEISRPHNQLVFRWKTAFIGSGLLLIGFIVWKLYRMHSK